MSHIIKYCCVMNLKKLFKKNDFIYIYYTRIRDWMRLKIWTDLQFKVRLYKKTHGVKPDLNFPKTYTEKLLWSSENYRDIRFVVYADKYAVREHVKKVIGEEYLIPIYDVFDDVNKMDISKYPKRFVLNATHGSNMILLCNDKDKFDEKHARKMVKSWLHRNYYERNREWHYNYMKPRVMCIENISTADGTPPLDYKFFCFDGTPIVVVLDIERFSDSSKINVYDMDWKQIKGVSFTHPQTYDRDYPKPKNFDLMKEIVKKLANGFEHVRVDLYNVDGKIYFGELTFLHAGAGIMGKVNPYEYNLKLGSYFKLPKRNIDTWKFNEKEAEQLS